MRLFFIVYQSVISSYNFTGTYVFTQMLKKFRVWEAIDYSF